MSSLTVEVRPSTRLAGEIRPPSDKSLTHRALLFAAMARSRSMVREPLLGEDCLRTLHALEALGARVTTSERQVVLEPGVSLGPSGQTLDCGNSGTTMRLLSGLLASEPGLATTLTGDSSLSRRPMGRIAEPLRRMGASILGEHPPLHIEGRKLQGIDYDSPVASAQVKSCVLIAGLRAQGQTSISEPHLSRDHTERMLESLGVRLTRSSGNRVTIEPADPWEGFEFQVPADISSAAFWMVAAALLPGSEVRLTDVGVNPTRTGVLDVLAQAGASVQLENARLETGEPVADLVVHGSAGLKGFEISGSLVPRLIDEIPVLCVMATQCEGVTVIRDAAELRVKETDRIQTVVRYLREMGAKAEPTADGMVVEGPTKLRGTQVDASGDHRIAMAFAVAGMLADGVTTIHNAESMYTSYPEFLQHAEALRVS